MNRTEIIPYGDDMITIEDKDGEWALKEPEITSIKPNYKRSDLVKILERDFDEWSKDEDWWSGRVGWDLNVYHIYPGESAIDYDGHIYSITVYGLELYDGHVQCDDSNVLDQFYIRIPE